MAEFTDQPAKRNVAVVGGGIVGLCLANTLADRGVSLWCFEQGTVGGGQSGGVTRIFRHSHERPRLVELALRARSSWTNLEQRLGERLIGDEGVLILTKEDEASRLKQLGVSVETLPWTTALTRMPFGQLGEGEPQIALEKDGGAIRARVAISALHQASSQSMIGAEVQGIEQHGSGATVFASDGIYEVDEVFVT
ncbi:MAG TPA: FAD-dependent oxidoreductase, partial [Solirubrobacterales bacterium]|nr:FAD-dependent oxidoreductase [Solirubrobacterales bacterium]